MELSVDFLTILIWYTTFSPFSAVTIASTLVISLAISTVLANVLVWVSPAISTVAASLVVVTIIVASVSVLSIYLVYVFVVSSTSSAFWLLINIVQLASWDFLSIYTLNVFVTFPSWEVIVTTTVVIFSLLKVIFLVLSPFSASKPPIDTLAYLFSAFTCTFPVVASTVVIAWYPSSILIAFLSSTWTNSTFALSDLYLITTV